MHSRNLNYPLNTPNIQKDAARFTCDTGCACPSCHGNRQPVRKQILVMLFRVIEFDGTPMDLLKVYATIRS